jgi:hypothetical protein
MATSCLSPMEWPAASPKVGPAASFPGRLVEEDTPNDTVESGTLAYTPTISSMLDLTGTPRRIEWNSVADSEQK